jgi:DNA-binding MarR family transcriptional regulator
MTAPSDLRTLVMHGLRLKGFAEPPSVADTVGVTEAEAKPVLDQLVTDGLATYRDGRLSGFTLTPEGRAEHARLLSEELDGHGVRDAVHAAYRRFLGHNGDLLAVCTAWQLRDVEGTSTINDHSDADYDAGVIDQLAEVHGCVQPICEELAASLQRFAIYGPRLAAALARVRAGETDWFTKPMIASYHTIWFELHEDLLATLGIERGSEVSA